MLELTEPMLAPRKLPAMIKYPVYASPKIDGMRAVVRDGVVLSRSLKPIANVYVQKLFGHLHGFDGELVVGPPNAKNAMQATQSGCRSRDGEPDVRFLVFDLWTHPETGYGQRYLTLRQWFRHHGEDNPRVSVLEQTLIECAGRCAECAKAGRVTLEQFEHNALAEGYEGVMLRKVDGLYVCGRRSESEGLLLKVKRFEDSEAEIVGAYELQHNDNEATTSETGHTKRSSSKAGKRAGGTLGGFHVRDLKSGVEFDVGTGLGLTKELRLQLWEEHLRGELVGRVITYKHFAAAGVVDKPRFPVFKSFRERSDL